jgi:hypothetical protein
MLREDDLPDQLVLALAFSPDGRRLAIGGGRTIYLWDLEAGKEVRQFGGRLVFGRALAFSADGTLLAAGQLDGTVRLWNVATGTVLCELPGHEAAVTSLAFAADGKRLASGSMDSTVLLWDVAAVRSAAPAPPAGLTPARAQALWQDLGGADAEKAFQAVAALSRHPDEAVALLQAKLRPVAPPEPARLQRLLQDLGDERYAVRERATHRLEELGELAAPALRELLAGKPSVEARQRAERLLGRLGGPVSGPPVLAAYRGIEVLEHVATPEARRVLEALAGGAPGHRITQEARASLERLARRGGATP